MYSPTLSQGLVAFGLFELAWYVGIPVPPLQTKHVWDSHTKNCIWFTSQKFTEKENSPFLGGAFRHGILESYRSPRSTSRDLRALKISCHLPQQMAAILYLTSLSHLLSTDLRADENARRRWPVRVLVKVLIPVMNGTHVDALEGQPAPVHFVHISDLGHDVEAHNAGCSTAKPRLRRTGRPIRSRSLST